MARLLSLRVQFASAARAARGASRGVSRALQQRARCVPLHPFRRFAALIDCP